MALRQATWGDISRMTDICAAAFDDDPQMRVLFPYKDAFPGDYRTSWYQQLRTFVFQPNVAAMVHEDPQDGVIGVAVWKLVGGQATELDLRKNSIGMVLGRKLAGLLTALHNRFFTDRAFEPRNAIAFGKAVQAKLAELWPQGSPPRWDFSRLAVDPAHQRRGLGTALTKWGTAQADRDGYVCFLQSSKVAHRLYVAAGFQDMGDIPLGETQMPVMVRKPWNQAHGMSEGRGRVV